MKNIHTIILLATLLVFTYCSKDSALELNLPPVAEAGPDQEISLPNNSVTLNGEGSKDPDGIIAKYEWTKVGGPLALSMANPSGKIVVARELGGGEYTFRLTVTDNRNQVATDDVKITVKPNASTPPTITDFAPTSGAVGTSVIISGSDFVTPVTVAFNGIAATVSAVTSTTITTTVPSGATTGPISITSKGKKITTLTSFTVTSLPVQISDVYFEGNMDNVTITANANNSNLSFNGWNALKTHPLIEEFYIDNINSSNTNANQFAYQQIVADPVVANRKVMNAVVVDDDPKEDGTTRAQITMGFKDGVDLSVYHTSHRMYIDPDVKFIESYSSAITWFVLSEIWAEDGVAKGIFPNGDVAGSARWGFTLRKASGSGQPLFWRIRAEYMQPESIAYNGIWTYENKTVPIPFGKWFTLDIYMKRGDASNGKYKITMTIDGEQPVVLFDVTGSTIYPGHPELQISAWQNFKLYLDDAYLDYMRNNSKKMSVFYNDFKWYKN
jgi:hypothetical protein